MPMPEIGCSNCDIRLAVERTESIAEITAAKPAAASLATMGVRVWLLISPQEFTKPAATFVPPTSTPMMYVFREICVMRGRAKVA